MWWWLAGAVLGVGGAVALASRERAPRREAAPVETRRVKGTPILTFGGRGIVTPPVADATVADLYHPVMRAVASGPMGKWAGPDYENEVYALGHGADTIGARRRLLELGVEAISYGIGAAVSSTSTWEHVCEWHVVVGITTEHCAWEPPEWDAEAVKTARDTATEIVRAWLDLDDEPRSAARRALWAGWRMIRNPPCDLTIAGLPVSFRMRELGRDCGNTAIAHSRQLADTLLDWGRARGIAVGGVGAAGWADAYSGRGTPDDQAALVAMFRPVLEAIARDKVTMWR